MCVHFSELREQRDRENDFKYDEKERKSHRKRKSRFGDGDEITEKTMVFVEFTLTSELIFSIIFERL